MTRLLSIGLTAIALMSGSPVFADSHCACDDKCAEECQTGKAENCPCKDCHCAHGEGCKHGKCDKKKQDPK